MRINITFDLVKKLQLLLLNYKYSLSSWIYKTLASSDAEFTHVLQQNALNWLSPIIVSKKIEGRKNPLHIASHYDDDNTIFSHNLIDKYRAHCRQTATEPKSYSEHDIRLKSLYNTAKSVKQTNKDAKKAQTVIRALKFDFKLQVLPELIEKDLNAWFGAKNAGDSDVVN